MTNNSPLDEHIKGKFSNYTPDVPSHIWENIIAEKEKRRPAGFWFSFLNKNILLLLFVIVTAGTGVIIYKNIYSTGDSKKTNTVNEPVNAAADNNLPATNNKTANDISTGPNSDPVTTTGNISLPADQVNKPNNNNIIPVDKAVVTTQKDRTDHNNKNNLLLSATDNNKNNFPVSTVVNNTTKSSSYKKQKKLKGVLAISFKNPDAIADDITTTVENDLLLKRFLLSLDMIGVERTFNGSVKKINNPHLDIPCPEAEKNAAGNKRYFEIYGGPDYAFRSITDTGNSDYMKKRKESSRFSSAFSAGLRYTRVFSNGMSFRTGINYSQINEKFKFSQGNIIQIVYITDNNGDTTGSYTTTGTRYKTTHNKFRTIDIPILVGYELGNGRLHANFNAGVVVNLYSWQKGDVLDTAYQPVNITTGKTASPYQFKTNAGIGFMGSVSVYYKITNRLHLLAEPYYRYNFSPASKSDLTLKQKYNTLGIRLGLRLDF